MRLRLHAFEPASRANGPGLRGVIWFQGCLLGCPGCYNPQTHIPMNGLETATDALWHQLAEAGVPIEGISISGGEPFQQPEAPLDLTRRAREAGLSVLIFSGYTRQAIERIPSGPAILAFTDVLIAGPYCRDLHAGRGLLGSTNQSIHFLTTRYGPADFDCLPRAEVVIHRDGTITISGISPVRLHP